jgi:hypothetical protein
VVTSILMQYLSFASFRSEQVCFLTALNTSSVSLRPLPFAALATRCGRTSVWEPVCMRTCYCDNNGSALCILGLRHIQNRPWNVRCRRICDYFAGRWYLLVWFTNSGYTSHAPIAVRLELQPFVAVKVNFDK